MERGEDWIQLGPLHDGRMNDGMEMYNCGLDGEVWEVKTLFYTTIFFSLQELGLIGDPSAFEFCLLPPTKVKIRFQETAEIKS